MGNDMFDDKQLYFESGFENETPMESESIDDAAVPAPKITARSKPLLYSVIVIHDQFTPENFVLSMLQQHFHASYAKAAEIMQEVMDQGQSTCGIYTREVAETKMMHVINLARESEFPLKCIIRRNSL